MYFDSHAHYNDEAFDADRDDAVMSTFGSGVELILNASYDRASCLSTLELVERYAFVYGSVGWHPHDAKSFTDESAEDLRAWCENPKIVAVGEIGLDYYYDHSERDVQREVFARQMELARELKLPVIVHNREAHADSLEIVRRFPDVRGVFHCFAGSAEMARELVDLGWYLGFGGAVTFKNAKRAPEVVAACPMDRLLIETDCPYLSPEPFRGRRNDSRMLPYIADRLAEIKGLSRDEIAAVSLENGKRLFGI